MQCDLMRSRASFAGNRASLPALAATAADADVPSAAGRPRAAARGKPARPFLELRDLAHTLFDIGAVLFGLFCLALYVGAVVGSIFVLLVAIS